MARAIPEIWTSRNPFVIRSLLRIYMDNRFSGDSFGRRNPFVIRSLLRIKSALCISNECRESQSLRYQVTPSDGIIEQTYYRYWRRQGRNPFVIRSLLRMVVRICESIRLSRESQSLRYQVTPSDSTALRCSISKSSPRCRNPFVIRSLLRIRR